MDERTTVTLCVTGTTDDKRQEGRGKTASLGRGKNNTDLRPQTQDFRHNEKRGKIAALGRPPPAWTNATLGRWTMDGTKEEGRSSLWDWEDGRKQNDGRMDERLRLGRGTMDHKTADIRLQTLVRTDGRMDDCFAWTMDDF